jgi:hypothetical protein
LSLLLSFLCSVFPCSHPVDITDSDDTAKCTRHVSYLLNLDSLVKDLKTSLLFLILFNINLLWSYIVPNIILLLSLLVQVVLGTKTWAHCHVVYPNLFVESDSHRQQHEFFTCIPLWNDWDGLNWPGFLECIVQSYQIESWCSLDIDSHPVEDMEAECWPICRLCSWRKDIKCVCACVLSNMKDPCLTAFVRCACDTWCCSKGRDYVIRKFEWTAISQYAWFVAAIRIEVWGFGLLNWPFW